MHSIVLPLIPGNKKLNIPSQYRISILLHAARSRYWVWSPGIVQLFYWTGVSATKRSLFINSYSYTWATSQSLIDFELNWHTHRDHIPHSNHVPSDYYSGDHRFVCFPWCFRCLHVSSSQVRNGPGQSADQLNTYRLKRTFKALVRLTPLQWFSRLLSYLHHVGKSGRRQRHRHFPNYVPANPLRRPSGGSGGSGWQSTRNNNNQQVHKREFAAVLVVETEGNWVMRWIFKRTIILWLYPSSL